MPRRVRRHRFHDFAVVPRIQPEHHAEIFRLVNDPAIVPLDHGEYLKLCEIKQRRLQRDSRVTVVMPVIDPQDLVAWCAETGTEPGVEAFIRFAYYRVHEVNAGPE